MDPQHGPKLDLVFGGFLGDLGGVLGGLGMSWRGLGRVLWGLEALGVSWQGSWPDFGWILGPTWSDFGAMLGIFAPFVVALLLSSSKKFSETIFLVDF